MAEEKKSIVLYCDIYSTVKKLSDIQAGQLFKHLLAYVNDEHPEPPKDFAVEIAFEPIKTSLKRDLVKYQARKERNRLNGQKGGRPTETEKPIENPENPVGLKKPDSDSDSDSDSVSDINNDKSLFNPQRENFIFQRNQIFGKELSMSESWIEAISMQNKMTPENVKGLIEDFNLKLLGEQDSKNSKKDYASHFSRWLKTQKENEKVNPQPTSPNLKNRKIF